MNRGENYFPDWQKARINFILSKFPTDFFKGKKILELGSYNGYIGEQFRILGSDVTCVEGFIDNVNHIKNTYPKLNVIHEDLDNEMWDFGFYDIIINFGLFYHLEKFHKEHLTNCITNTNLLFFETVVFDSDEPTLYCRDEEGDDQSLSNVGCSPSTSFVENIFIENNTQFKKFTDESLNGYPQHYSWEDKNSRILNPWARRFWVVENKLY